MLSLYILILWGLLVLLGNPYERVVIRRILTVRKIKKLCCERDIKFKVINRMYPFSLNKKNQIDFIFRIDNTVIPVKFFSAIDKNATIILDHSGKICTVRYYKKPLSSAEKAQIKTVKRYGRIAPMRIKKKMVGERNVCFPVLLNEPSFKKVLFRDERGDISNFYEGTHRVAEYNFVDRSILFDLVSIYEVK